MAPLPHLWLRPWARFPKDSDEEEKEWIVRAGSDAWPQPAAGYDLDPRDAPHVAERIGRGPGGRRAADLHEEFRFGDRSGRQWRVSVPSRPRSPSAGTTLRFGDAALTLKWPDAPDRPPVGHRPEGLDPVALDRMERVKRVVARIQEVERALDDPIRLWQRLDELWFGAEEESEPETAAAAAEAGSALARYLPWAGGALAALAVAVFLWQRREARRIAALRREDAGRV